MFGGEGNDDILSDTWLFNGSCWNPVTTSSSPSPRYFTAAAFNPQTHNVFVYGGRAAYPTWFDETWVWDGAAWTQLHPTKHPTITAPVASYDPTIQKIVVYGLAASGVPQTWTWDGVAWQELLPASTPSTRFSTSLAYDPLGHSVILFGGRTNTGYLRDTWSFDGTNWKQLVPTNSPPARARSLMASVSQGIVLFGGETPNGGPLPWETWLWNGSTWQHISTVHSPPSTGPAAGITSVNGSALMVVSPSWSDSVQVHSFTQSDWSAS